ncbi:SIMPL domain-containing protein [Actinoplanes sp. NPDC020271]|uniref:SIMPL domain-containing protein n=1 Tax=Actinoplanes sp. NPDC020271 TaxID=3363896 RepID=UPI0037AEEFE7
MKKTRVAVQALVVLAALAGPETLTGSQPALAAGTTAGGRAVLTAGTTAGSRSALTAGTTAGSRSALATGATASQVAEQERESIVVSGTGEVSGTPDVLVANFAVETDAPAVGSALDRAAAAATRMRDALVRAGIAKADLTTSDVSVTARRNATKITGYTASQGLTAKIRDLPKAGSILSAAVASGGDSARLSSTSFTIEDDSALLAEARRKAFADARGKAQSYAREAGRPLGRVVRVSEESAGFAGASALRGMAYADQPVPVEPGRQQVVVTVTVEWALGADGPQ